jgi:TolB protein
VFAKFLTLLCVFCLTELASAQTEPTSGLKNFQNQNKILTSDGGKWRTDNPSFNPQDEWSARYFGYEFIAGVNANTVRLKITGYLPKKSQWVVFWDGYYSWDSKRNKVIYNSSGADGSLASGESESIGALESSLVFAVTTPDGKIEIHKDVQRIEIDKIISESFIKMGNKWERKNILTWVRLEQPTGVLAFMSTRDGNFEVYTMKANGDSAVNLTCNKASDYGFSFAPGKRLVFYSNRDGNDEVYIMEADGKKVTNLTNHPSADRITCVSPDGSKIVFSSNRGGKSADLFVMNIDGSEVKQLTSNDNYEDAPTWSPDGKKILFSKDLKAVNETSSHVTSNGEIFIMDVDGTNEKRLTNRDGFDGGPQFSPDGKQIAFYGKTADGNYEIFIMDADGSNVINLTEDELEDYSPSWSPDGQWIAYTKGNSKNYDVWIINIETHIKYRLTTQTKRDESPFWLHQN